MAIKISPLPSGSIPPTQTQEPSAWAETAKKISVALAVFSILVGSAVALLWSVPFGLLAAGAGLAVSLAISYCAPKEEPKAPPAEKPADPIILEKPKDPILVAKTFSHADNVAFYHETMAHSLTHFKAATEALVANVSIKVGLPPVVRPAPYPDALKPYVKGTSTMRTAQEMVERGLNPLVGDFANENHAGGGVRGGANAQEEILCRQSNLMHGLLKLEKAHEFPIPEFGGILAPKVTFFRKDPNEDYEYLEKPFEADVFAFAAYNLSKDLRPKLDPNYETGMTNKIINLLRAAIENGNDSVVLGAFGCGAFKGKFKNVPDIVAAIFKKVLEDAEFKGQFKEVAFGIIEDHNSNGNYQIFKNLLEN